jgi:hypothetical protein
MPTYDRRRFVPLALDYFARQTYANRELVVVDDGRDPIRDLLPRDRTIRYVRLKSAAAIVAKGDATCAIRSCPKSASRYPTRIWSGWSSKANALAMVLRSGPHSRTGARRSVE